MLIAIIVLQTMAVAVLLVLARIPGMARTAVSAYGGTTCALVVARFGGEKRFPEPADG